MRVPDSLRSLTVRGYLSRTTDRLARLQTEVASGIRIQRPSDDPGGALRAASLRSGLSKVKLYTATVEDARTWLKSEDTVLGDLQETVRQIRTSGLQGANPLSTEARDTLAGQIEAMRKVLLQEANETDGLRFLFGGFHTTAAPFSMDSATGVVSYAGDAGAKEVSIGDGYLLQINHAGDQVFNMNHAADAGDDLFVTVATLANAVRAGDVDVVQTQLNAIDTHMTRIAGLRAETGTRLQQADLAADRLLQSKLTLSNMLSETEGADLSEVLVHLKEQENILQAATYVASTMQQGGLLQWLR